MQTRMTSSYGNIFNVTGPFLGEYTGHLWILLTKTSDAEFWCSFFLSVPKQTAETIKTLEPWDAIAGYDVTAME